MKTIHRFFLRSLYFSAIIFIASCGNRTDNSAIADNDPVTTTTLDKQANESTKRILIFGNSLTAGYGLDDQKTAFPGLIQSYIDSLGLPYEVTNAGLSGETSAGGNERVDWLLRDQVDIFILELGANDGLRGIPTDETYKNLQSIIDKVKTAHPAAKLVLAGMMVPPSMGSDFGTRFAAIYPKLAKENDMALIPFLLEGVAGDTALNLGDGIHPNIEGQKIVANNVWEVLEPLL